jgi:hypothetical protein
LRSSSEVLLKILQLALILVSLPLPLDLHCEAADWILKTLAGSAEPVRDVATAAAI